MNCSPEACLTCNQGDDCPARRPMLVSPFLYYGLFGSIIVWTGLCAWLLA